MANKLTQSVKTFRGLRQFLSRTLLTPEYAEDCLNVIVSRSGGLEKFRIPIPFTAQIANIGVIPILPFIDYQQAGVRQVFGTMGTNLVVWDMSLTPTIVDTNNLNAQSLYQFLVSNNILLLMNQSRALKWLGAQQKLQLWGIAAPTVAPTVLICGGNIDTIGNSGAVRAGGIVTLKTTAPHNLDSGDVGGNITVAGVSVGANTFNGTFVTASVPDNMHITYVQAGANETQGGGTLVVANGYAITTSKSFGISYHNPIDGHESSIGPLTNLGPNATATGYKILKPTPPPSDPQVGYYVVWASQDGGGQMFLAPTSDPVNGVPVNLNYIDVSGDNGLLTNSVPQYINNPPPLGKYLAKFQDRVFIFGLISAPQTIAYSGFEQILRGRPEQSFPPGNQLRLSVGADDLRGGGAIQSGIVAFDKSKKMYMFRGIVEDIVSTAPVVFSSYLEELPWSIGCLSHYTIQSTPYGLVWLASDRTVQLFDGTNHPQDLSGGVYPILSRITDGREESCRSSLFNWLEREWYVLLLPLDGATAPNMILFFDLAAQDNFGCFPAQIQADAIGVVEDVTGRRHLIISQSGQLLELKVASLTVGGINPNPTVNPANPVPILTAFWRGGYFGNDTPQLKRQWRSGRLTTDQDQTVFRMRSRLIDGDKYTFKQPRTMDHTLYSGGKFDINWKGTRLGLEVVFPDADMDASVLEVYMESVPIANKV